MSFFIPTKRKAAVTAVLVLLWLATAKLLPAPIGGLPLLTFAVPAKIIMEQTATRYADGTIISAPISPWIASAVLIIWVILEFYLLACLIVRLADYLARPTISTSK